MGFAVRQLAKSYAGVPVLNEVDLAVGDGEIHMLLGANGAGKSTLIKCISGAITPDSGRLQIGDQEYASLTPREAARAGVAVIYQDPVMASTLNVAENMFLGQERRAGPLNLRRAQEREAGEWLAKLGLDFSPTAPLSQLGTAEVQMVAIAKALRSDPRILILDEPTAALTAEEEQRLSQHLLGLKAHRLPILYVTHRLGEVFELGDSVTVLRSGEVVVSGPVSQFSQDELVTAIAGRSVDRARVSSVNGARGDLALRVRDLVGPRLGPIDLNLSSGEIVGVFGVVGSGRTELVETLFGARAAHGGTLELDGEPLTVDSPTDAVAAGIALVPSDRQRKSVFTTLAASDNVLFPSLRRLSRRAVRRRGREREAFSEVTEGLNLQPRRSDLEARRFSGGNQQKLALSRWLVDQRRCRVLLLDEPTQGVDVGARSDLYRGLRKVATAGCAVLVTSSEPEELVEVADRAVVLSRGRVVATLEGDDITAHALLRLAHFNDPTAVGP